MTERFVKRFGAKVERGSVETGVREVHVVPTYDNFDEYNVYDENRNYFGTYSRSEAYERAAQLREAEREMTPVFTVPITPMLKKAALRGMELSQAPAPDDQQEGIG